ncbi:Endoglucanase [Thalictrum thalictroides]|uniref:Endoglucanase n=1 Tax=Thalictrum thalictroides TaxID=46969 RepID=A0A7J6WJX8_THATH|nr:Endoglucanase [Thalictrum thalictroides]
MLLDEFICKLVQEGSDNVKRSPRGLNWWQPWSNLQYTNAATLIATMYSKYLATAKASIDCYGVNIKPEDLVAFAKSQVDYILGSNPKSMSYMVGYGTNYPKQIHHRGASIVSIKKDPAHVSCKGADPNVLEGAVVGGPYDTDEYTDARSNYQQSEPTLTNNAPLVGVLAKLV